jgi:hypothetical protein
LEEVVEGVKSRRWIAIGQKWDVRGTELDFEIAVGIGSEVDSEVGIESEVVGGMEIGMIPVVKGVARILKHSGIGMSFV